MPAPIHLDGTTLEGGGQLLRIAIGLSALTSTPLRITNIRGNRSGGGGLKTQHLTAVHWLAAATSATTTGAEKKSLTLSFTPNPSLHPSQLTFPTAIDIGSPGSIGLVFQAILPFILFSGHSSPVRLSITGGTNVPLSPSFDYITHVLLPTLSLIGLPPITASLHTRGWSSGPHRLGRVDFAITPLPLGATLPAFTLSNRSAITAVEATLLAPPEAWNQACAALNTAVSAKIPALDLVANPDALSITLEDSHHPARLYLLLVARTATGHVLGRDWLFDRKIRSLPQAVAQLVERVTGELAVEIEHGGAVDVWARDQVVVFQALARGRSVVDGGEKVEASLHARTAEWVGGRVLRDVVFDGEGECEGCGFVAGEGRRGGGKEEEEEVEEEEEGVVEGLQRLSIDED